MQPLVFCECIILLAAPLLVDLVWVSARRKRNPNICLNRVHTRMWADWRVSRGRQGLRNRGRWLRRRTRWYARKSSSVQQRVTALSNHAAASPVSTKVCAGINFLDREQRSLLTKALLILFQLAFWVYFFYLLCLALTQHDQFSRSSFALCSKKQNHNTCKELANKLFVKCLIVRRNKQTNKIVF